MPAPSIFNEFPFCIPIANDEIDPNYGSIISRDRIFKWLYRVKKWSVKVQNPSEFEGGPLPPVIEFEIGNFNRVNYLIEGDSETPSESTLVSSENAFSCPLFGEYEGESSSLITFCATKFQGVKFSDLSPYVYANFSAGRPGSAGPDNTGFFIYNNSYYFVPQKSVGESPVDPFYFQSATWKIDGVDFPGTGETGTYEFYLSVDLSPIEFWPYNPNDGGGPIVDASTGAILRQL